MCWRYSAGAKIRCLHATNSIQAAHLGKELIRWQTAATHTKNKIEFQEMALDSAVHTKMLNYLVRWRVISSARRDFKATIEAKIVLSKHSHMLKAWYIWIRNVVDAAADRGALGLGLIALQSQGWQRWQTWSRGVTGAKQHDATAGEYHKCSQTRLFFHEWCYAVRDRLESGVIWKMTGDKASSKKLRVIWTWWRELLCKMRKEKTAIIKCESAVKISGLKKWFQRRLDLSLNGISLEAALKHVKSKLSSAAFEKWRLTSSMELRYQELVSSRQSKSNFVKIGHAYEKWIIFILTRREEASIDYIYVKRLMSIAIAGLRNHRTAMGRLDLAIESYSKISLRCAIQNCLQYRDEKGWWDSIRDAKEGSMLREAMVDLGTFAEERRWFLQLCSAREMKILRLSLSWLGQNTEKKKALQILRGMLFSSEVRSVLWHWSENLATSLDGATALLGLA